MIPSQYYGADGRFDPNKVEVHGYEVAYARANYNGSAPLRDIEHTTRNIALGKVCGSYDPEPAWTWHIRRVIKAQRDAKKEVAR